MAKSSGSTSSPPPWGPAAALALLAVLALAPAVQADWLVTREGERVETSGPWSVRGKLVVFKLANGTLSSLRAEEVDLTASEAATKEAKAKQEQEKQAAAQPAAEQPRRKPIRVLTDKDFKKETPPGEADKSKAAADGEAPAAQPVAQSDASGLDIAGWDRVEETGFRGVEIAGTLRNSSNDTVTDIDLQASFFDESGNLIARAPAELAEPALGPGQSTGFTVKVEGTYAFSAVKFQARGGGFRPRQAPPPAPPAENTENTAAPPP